MYFICGSQLFDVTYSFCAIIYTYTAAENDEESDYGVCAIHSRISLYKKRVLKRHPIYHKHHYHQKPALLRIALMRMFFESPPASHIAKPLRPIFLMKAPLAVIDLALSYEIISSFVASYTKGYQLSPSATEIKEETINYRLAAIIKCIGHPGGNLSSRCQQSFLNQAPERNISALWLFIAALIHPRLVVPGITSRCVARIKWWVEVQLGGRVMLQGGGLVDAERVAVTRDAKDNLVEGHAGRVPFLDGGDGGTLLVVRGSAGVVEWCVGTNGSTPWPLLEYEELQLRWNKGEGSVPYPDIIIHNFYIIKNVGEVRDVRGGVSIGVGKWENGGGSGENEASSN
jgi:hypothetical protein